MTALQLIGMFIGLVLMMSAVLLIGACCIAGDEDEQERQR